MMNYLPNPNWIWVGQRLNIPCSGHPLLPGPGNPPGICHVYIVRWGDYLKLIAARFGTTWEAIARVNHLWNPNFVYPGQILRIP